MRKLVLLFALLSVAPLARANSTVDYDTGLFMSGTLMGSFTNSINVNIVGSLNTVDIITGTLVKTTSGCPPGSTCFDFTGGSVKVSEGGGTVFFDTLSGGITVEQSGAASLQAVLTNGHGIVLGNATATFDFTGTKIMNGSADVSFQRSAVTPEPASLLLFGTGLAAFAVKFHRRLLQKES